MSPPRRIAHPDRVTLELVGPTIREAGALLKENYLPQGWFSVATFQEPGWRIEGKKSLGLELAEPAAGDTRWSLPDAVIYPTGGGTGVLGMWKAWDELEALGLIDARRPRMLCVQSEAMAPLVRAFDAGARRHRARPGRARSRSASMCRRASATFACWRSCALAVALRRGGRGRHRRGAGARWQRTHGWLSPEGAACLAALPQLLDRGLLKRGERVVVVNTGRRRNTCRRCGT